MKSNAQIKGDRLAVLIDADNASASLIDQLLKEVSKYGTATVKRIYGDWTKPQLGSWKNQLNKFAIQPIQQFCYTEGKNSTDSALIIDAMDLLYTENFEGFCLVASDSDYTRLATRIREAGLVVYGFGEQKTPKPFVAACNRFIYTELLIEPAVQPDAHTAAETLSGAVGKAPVPLTHSSPNATKTSLQEDSNLIGLLKDAYEATAGENGWANLAPVGAQLTKLSPDFDSRIYDCKTLGKLVREVGLFEVREVPHDKGQGATLEIKLRDPL